MHQEITNIFAKIANAQAEKKIRYIDLSKQYMNETKNEVTKKSNFIKDTVNRLNMALNNTIPKKDLNQRLENQMIKFMKKEYCKAFKLEQDKDLNSTKNIINFGDRRQSEVGGFGGPKEKGQRMLSELDFDAINPDD